ncbi:hypothetical protein [Escherichia phage phiWec196]|nr:hypothetical protein [Escherichia phage phiWec196]
MSNLFAKNIFSNVRGKMKAMAPPSSSNDAQWLKNLQAKDEFFPNGGLPMKTSALGCTSKKFA